MTSPTTLPPPPHVQASFLRRLRISNFRSIAHCDVGLAPLTVLVGRNGSGKSNFLDALRFVADALETTVEHALKRRGGIEAVRRHGTGHPRNFGVRMEFALPDAHVADYAFEIAARQSRGFVVRRESLRVCRAPHGEPVADYDVQEGVARTSSGAALPRGASDRLFLVTASGLPAYRPAYDALRAMGFYNLLPETMRELQSPDAGQRLSRDGSNVASVVGRLQAESPATMDRVGEYLSRIVSGVTHAERVALGPRETLLFRQTVEGAKHPWRFHAISMSDGTLRAFGVLVAVMQLTTLSDPVRLVGIEEPETTLHPQAATALMQALREASRHTQIVVTTHSADLLDGLDERRDALLVVESRLGTTHVAAPDGVARQAIEQHLYSTGELLRMGEIRADEADVERQSQASLFDA